ncbi:MAG: TIR domain-containing protein [Rubrivivax sp.]
MTVVSGYSHDCFISYSHLDNMPFGDPPLLGWVDIFHKDLQNFTSVYMGRATKVWRDKRLTGAEVFSAEIEQKLRGSAVLISIVSPGYLQSDWCNRELSGFVQSAMASGSLRVGNLQRVMKVLRLPVEVNLLPAFMDDMVGTPFFRVDDASKRVRDLLVDEGADATKVFRARVDDVAQDVMRVLKAMADTGIAGPTPKAQKRVFLAWTASDLGEDRERLRRELEERGHQVVPKGDPPLSADRLTAAVNEALKDAAVAVHLVGSHYGFVPEDESRSVVELQGEATLQIAVSAGVPCIFWQKPAATTIEPRLSAMIARVQQQAGTAGVVDVMADQTLEHLKTLVLDRLMPVASPPKVSTGVRPLVYLVCSPLDREAVASIRQLLFEASMEVRLPLFEGDAEEIRLEHEQLLKECAGVLIYWGHAKEAWLRKQLRDLKHVFGISPLPRTAPFAARGLYIGSPPDPDKDAYMTHELPVLRIDGQSDAERLAPFLSALNGG